MKHFTRTARIAALAVVALGAWTVTHAELVINAHPGSSSQSTPSNSRIPGSVTQVGTSPITPSLAEGWADNVPLILAFQQVVPSGWTIREDLSASDKASQVSWSGGRSWPVVLGDLAARGKVNAEIKWDAKTVSLHPSWAPVEVAQVPPPVLTSISPKSTSKSSVPQVSASQPNATAEALPKPTKPLLPKETIAPPPVVMVPPPPLPEPVKWVLDAKLSLKENVEAWAKKAGWNSVVWEAADYPIVAPAVFTGDFDSPEGPLARLIAAFETSDQPLLVELSTLDKVVHVSNKNYRQVVVESQTAQSFSPESFNHQ